MTRISVIIPTKYREKDILNCLESISIQTLKPIEVIVVDSSDTEELRSVLESFSDLNIKYFYLRIDGKRFKGSQQIAMNKGLDESSGDILLFLDDDVILDKDYIRNIADVFEHDVDGRIGGVTGEIVEKKRIINPLKNFLTHCYGLIPFVFMLLREGDGKFQASGFPTSIKSGSTNKLLDVEFLYGCNMAFRKKILSEFRFDENLNIHGCCSGDDDEIAYRISRKYQNIYSPFAKVVHNMSPVRSNRYAKNKLIVINHYYLFKRYRSQDLKHAFAFWWSIIGLFVREGIVVMSKRNRSGMQGLADGMKEILKR